MDLLKFIGIILLFTFLMAFGEVTLAHSRVWAGRWVENMKRKIDEKYKR